MVRLKDFIFYDSNRSTNQSEVYFFAKSLSYRTATCFRRSLSISFITSVYCLLICIMITSVISSPNLIFPTHLNSNNNTNFNNSSSKRLDKSSYIISHKSSNKPHNLNNLNNSPKFSINMLNNKKSSFEAISSVLPLKHVNLSNELHREVFTETQLSLDLSNLNNQRSLTKNEANNLTEHPNFIKSTLSPLLLKLSTFQPPNVHETDLDKDEQQNRTNNATELMKYSFPIQITISVGLLVLIILTIIGNIFVIAAICLDKNLRIAQNYLVLSLAVADLTVAILVMPPAAVYEIYQSWVLGSEMCVFWNLIDVFSCTASILHLLAIALDRYWSVSSLHYSQGRSSQRMMYTIIAIWLAAAVVSMPPLLGVKDPEYELRLQMGRCLMSQDVGYQIFATMSTFYVPSVVILFLYWKIYQITMLPAQPVKRLVLKFSLKFLDIMKHALKLR